MPVGHSALNAARLPFRHGPMSRPGEIRTLTPRGTPGPKPGASAIPPRAVSPLGRTRTYNLRLRKPTRCPLRHKEKSEDDGTRTRDRRRDKPVLPPTELHPRKHRVRDSNPCHQLERLASYPLDERGVSGWQDSNLRPLPSKGSALTKLRYIQEAEAAGLEPATCRLTADRSAN